MSTLRIQAVNRRQSGVVVSLVLVLLATGVYIGSKVNASPYKQKAQQQRLSQLLSAKQALIAYAVTYSDNYSPTGAGYGHFPCPDHDPFDDLIDTNDGPDPPCANANIGRLARYTSTRPSMGFGRKLLEFHMHKTLIDQPLWYAISQTYINNPLNRKVNPDTKGEFSVDGESNIVAVIVSPGAELRALGQTRPSNRLQDYMEGDNSIPNNRFFRYPISKSNDLLVTIRSEEFMPLVQQRVANFLISELRNYWQLHCSSGEACYPSAVMGDECLSGLETGHLPLFREECTAGLVRDDLLEQVNANNHWFVRNDWQQFVRYTRDPACLQDLSGQCEISTKLEGENLEYINILVSSALSSS